MAIIHEINPALDLKFIFSEYRYTGEQEFLNALKVKIRGHLYERMAVLADIIFYGKLISGESEDLGEDSSATRWVCEKL